MRSSTNLAFRDVTVALLALFSVASIPWYPYDEQLDGRFVATAFLSREQASSWVSSPGRTRVLDTGKSTARSALNGENGENGYTFRDSWSLITLGDLHMEDDMSHHEQARRDCLIAIEDYPILGSPIARTNGANGSSQTQSSSELTKETIAEICETPGGELTEEELLLLLARKQTKHPRSHLVSLGDLGRKDIRHEQGDAGTTKSFVDAKTYFDGFEGIPYDLVTVCSSKIETAEFNFYFVYSKNVCYFPVSTHLDIVFLALCDLKPNENVAMISKRETMISRD